MVGAEEPGVHLATEREIEAMRLETTPPTGSEPPAGATLARADRGLSIEIGDIIRWHGSMAEVTDVATFPGLGTQIVVELLRRSGRPVSLTGEDIAGVPVWRVAAAG